MADRDCHFCGDNDACKYISMTSDAAQYAPLGAEARTRAKEVTTCNQDKYKQCPLVSEAAQRLSDKLAADF
jgi:hypothetical protein